MDKCREEFEKKLKCQDLLSELTFREEISSYVGDILPTNLATINGAYWAWEKRQTEVDELQKRVDSVTHLIRGLRAEFDLWMDVECPQVERQIELLEQALKGEGCQ